MFTYRAEFFLRDTSTFYSLPGRFTVYAKSNPPAGAIYSVADSSPRKPQRLNELYSLDLRACSESFDRTQNSVNYEYCLEEASELYLSRFNTYKERIPQLLVT